MSLWYTSLYNDNDDDIILLHKTRKKLYYRGNI